MDEVPSLDVKIERFDRVFFFILGLTGLIISLVKIPSINGEINVVFDIPFLLIGIVIPLYIGYFRGAIELESIKRRVRGWIYYFVGMTAYFSLLASNSLKVISERQTVFIVIGVFGLIIAYFFVRWSKKIFGIEGNSCQYSFSGTAFSAFSIAFACHLLVVLSIDLQGKNLVDLLFRDPELLFWSWTLITIFLWCVSLRKHPKMLLKMKWKFSRQKD